MLDDKESGRISAVPCNPHGQHEGMMRNLEVRHLQMIAIGASIGTGLFLTTGSTIANAGAIGALIAYLIAGISVFFVVHSLGEMATLIPTTGSFNDVDPALGFTSGWIYWFGCTISIPIELLACVKILQYWIPLADKYVIMAILLVFLVLVNCFAVKGFGEIEYWLSLIKISAIVFFIIITIYIIVKENQGFETYAEAGGPFLGKSADIAAVNIFNALTSAIFAFAGTELVGVTAGEAKNPRKSVPKAINGTFWRIMIFYIVSIFLIGLLVPANEPAFQRQADLASSPFVISLQKGNFPGAEHFMNFVCFIAVFSSANSTVYASTRILMALAQTDQAPVILGRTARNGVPYYATFVSILIGCSCFIGSFIGDGELFDFLVNVCGLGVIVIWCMICVVHLRFRQAYAAQGYLVEDLPFKAWLFPYGAYFAILISTLILIASPIFAALQLAEDKSEKELLKFLASLLTIPVYATIFVAYKLVRKTKVVPLTLVDLKSGNINLHPELEGEIDIRDSKWEKVLGFFA